MCIRDRCGKKDLLDEGFKAVAVDGPVDCHRTTHAPMIQRRDERGGLPMSVGNPGDQTLANGRTASDSRHVGLGPGLINKHDLLWVQSELAYAPLSATVG